MLTIRRVVVGVFLSLSAFCVTAARSAESAPANEAEGRAKPPAADTPERADADHQSAAVEKLAERALRSVVVVSFTGRDGQQEGMGAGVVVSSDGLIATNLHVIGEARPIDVQFAGGRRHPVTAIHATDRAMDLALLRIDAQHLPALELGDSDSLKPGQPVVAIGNPLGLKHSVVTGVVSGRREIDGKPMIQLAIPIERGNSGGPMLDMSGRVQGLLTMKSAVTENLGFAVAVNALKPLLAKPNPVPTARWLTIGALDETEWAPLFGARWRQRAGRIIADGRGPGIGRRSLCLSKHDVPELPFELAVTVRLSDESGAAGLVFHSDGDEKHYGFYPSNTGLRLSHFDGPDVFSWQVLKQVQSEHYRPGEWNTLKVRLETDRVQCFVNDQPVIEWDQLRRKTGRVGLAQFRETEAQFKAFQVAKMVPPSRPPDEAVKRISMLASNISADRPPSADLVQELLPDAHVAPAVLGERARLLEKQAERLRQLASAVHVKQVQQQLVEALRGEEPQNDLFHAALLIARLDNQELDVDAYRRQVDRMVAELTATVKAGATDPEKLEALHADFFQQRGFHGSRTDYYHRSNSYLNEVIDDREGLPITLSILYMELARRLGLEVAGVGLPGHFVVRFQPKAGQSELIDVFDGGIRLSRQQAEEKVQSISGQPLRDEHLAAMTKRAIVVRMLHNLMGVARNSGDAETMRRYVDTIVAIDPDAAEERWFRAVLNYQTGRTAEARADAEWLQQHQPDGIDLDEVRKFQRVLDQGK